jgi:hypothetical protein
MTTGRINQGQCCACVIDQTDAKRPNDRKIIILADQTSAKSVGMAYEAVDYSSSAAV